MKQPGLQGEFWPDRKEELLLKTAMLEGEAAVRAWKAVRGSFDMDDHTGDSYRLMPLLYRSLRELDINDPCLPLMRGFVRRTWYQNQVLLHDVAGVLQHLREAGIDTLALKGAAMLEIYGDASLRPMGDFDLLVPYEDARRAFGLLQTMGWRPDSPLTPKLLKLHHGTPLTRDGLECDLHWRVLRRFEVNANENQDFWRSSEPVLIGGAPTRVLCPADQLLHICVHSARWDAQTNVRWAADAITIMRRRDVDWGRLLVMTRRHRVTLPMRDTLVYLVRTLAAPVPDEVIAALERSPVSRREAHVYRVDGRRPEMGSITRGFPLTVERYARLSVGWSLSRTIAGFPGYLQDTYRLRSTWSVPGHLFKRATGRVSGDEHKQRTRQG